MCELIFRLVTIERESCAGSIADLTFALLVRKSKCGDLFSGSLARAASHNTEFLTAHSCPQEKEARQVLAEMKGPVPL